MALFRWVLHRRAGTSDSVGQVRQTLAQRFGAPRPIGRQPTVRPVGDEAVIGSHAIRPATTLRKGVSPASGNGQILGRDHSVPAGSNGSHQTPPHTGAGQPGPARAAPEPVESIRGRRSLAWPAGGLGRRRHDHGRQSGDSPPSHARRGCAGGGRRGVSGCATRLLYDQGRRRAREIWRGPQTKPEKAKASPQAHCPPDH